MHYQSPPLIHRDLKVENILLSPPQTFKLCDFGSTTKPLPREKVPTAVEGIQKIELEINKTTTLQYRAPELVDVWGRKGFDEKIGECTRRFDPSQHCDTDGTASRPDIWALGVLLYKLCYYTTPFEENGPLAILNAQYKVRLDELIYDDLEANSQTSFSVPALPSLLSSNPISHLVYAARTRGE